MKIKGVYNMTFDKRPFQLRMTSENKKICQELGSDVLRRVLELNIKEFYSNKNINIAILEDDIKSLKDKRNKLLEDNRYYEKRIQQNEESIKKFSNLIELKNKELRDSIEIKEHQTKELKHMFDKVKTLIKNNQFNELEMQEIIENRKYCSYNQIIENIILELKKEGADAEIIVVVENCKK